MRWGRWLTERPAFSPFPQWGEANGQHSEKSDQLSLPIPSEVRQTASTTTSSLSLSPVRWGRRRAQRAALSPFPQWGEADGQHSDQHSLPIPNEVKQTAIKATSSLFLSPQRWGRRRAQRQALSPYPKWGEEDGEQSDQLSLPYPSEVRQTGSIATSSLSISQVRWGRRRAQRPTFSPYPQWGEGDGELGDLLALPNPSEERQTASTATSFFSLSPVRWGRRRAQRPAFSPYPQWGEADASTATSSLSLSSVRWGKPQGQQPALSPFPQWGEEDGQHSDQLSLPFLSEMRKAASIATSSLSLSPVKWGKRRAQRPTLSPFPHWGEADGEHSDQLSFHFPSEVRQTVSTATSSLSLSSVRWGKRRA